MTDEQQEYRVLARKYRPQNFDDLIGQEPLVRTLKNAIEYGRIAHAFMLTGIRGVGKTTTARIIAKALNYAGPDGNAGPTTGNTDDCEICQAISEDRHPDVIEMDAASRTGVDDIREIIDGVRYAPTSARFKVYIIDEVHMLSKNAFNALLKTLEEPPAHVKFIFATTEIRKVPITVLSRCQRFDLRRIELEDLAQHFKNICEKENTSFEDEAITMIAQATDGSVRDGLSILDQAIALGDATVSVETVKNMLGLTDGSQLLDLFENALSGNPKEALEILDALYLNGADPAMVIEDLLNITHALTKLRVLNDGETGDLSALPHGSTERAKTLAFKLSMPALNRAWQIFMKGLAEVRTAPHPQKAAEMVLIRLVYTSGLPDPKDLIKKIEAGEFSAVTSSVSSSGVQNESDGGRTIMRAGGGQMLAAVPREVPQPESIEAFQDIDHLYTFLKSREVLLAQEIYECVHPIKFSKGVIEIRLNEGARADIPQRMIKALKEHTGTFFKVPLSKADGEATLSERAEARRLNEIEEAKKHPNVAKILHFFPNAEVTEILKNDK